MFFTSLSRQKSLTLLTRHLSSSSSSASSTAAASSKLYDHYCFKPPPSLSPTPENPNPNKNVKNKSKPRYRPPSSLHTKKKIRSDLPFDFQYSYTESSQSVRPIGLREPKYSPFGPGRLDRQWTGVCAPAVEPKVKSMEEGAEDPKLEEKRRIMRGRIQGELLTNAERKALVEKCIRNRTKRQINLGASGDFYPSRTDADHPLHHLPLPSVSWKKMYLRTGRDGLTHNMLNDIYNHWKHSEAVRIKCLGVPTVDMKNVCTQLEDKMFGKIIYRHGGTLVLYRGRNYNPKKRPLIPLMLWKPHEPVYPRLIKTTIDGLSIEETKEMRKRGLSVPALTKLAKNGYYGSLVSMVRDAFVISELVRIDCQGLERSDYKKIGAKLRDLVPCILVTFDKEQIVVWRGKDYKPLENEGHFLTHKELFDDLVTDLVGRTEEKDSTDERIGQHDV